MEPLRDENLGDFRHPETLENQTPSSLMTIYSLVIHFLQHYGWFALFGVIVAVVIRQKLQQYMASRPAQQSAAPDLHHYDSEMSLKRQEAFEASRQHLQEKLNADAEHFKEEQKKKEEEKRRQKITDWENHLAGKGYRSKYKPPEETSFPSSSFGTTSSQKRKPTYKSSDYNPLAGSGGGGGGAYRPPARRGGGG